MQISFLPFVPIGLLVHVTVSKSIYCTGFSSDRQVGPCDWYRYMLCFEIIYSRK